MKLTTRIDFLDPPGATSGGSGTRDSHREWNAQRIVNGVGTVRHPAVGALLHGETAGAVGIKCSGTLIGAATFLTAAHCVAPDPQPERYFVYFQHAGIVQVKEIRWPEDDYKAPAHGTQLIAARGSQSRVSPEDSPSRRLSESLQELPLHGGALPTSANGSRLFHRS